MPFKGAGGTEGGIGRFFLGLTMMVAGGYLFLNSITVSHNFSMGYAFYRFRNIPITSGMVLIPFGFGIGMIFYNAKNLFGWFFTIASLIMLSVGVITSIDFHFRSMSAFELLMILVLLIGGIGLFLSSLKSFEKSNESLT